MASAWAAGLKPVAFRLASLPASAEPGQELVLCATNVGTGAVDVSLEIVNVRTGGLVAEKTVSLAPLGSAHASQPCLTTTVQTAASTQPKVPMSSSFAAAESGPTPENGQALVVGVAMVRKPLFSFREAQVTASIQVLTRGEGGAVRTVATIPLSRTTHSQDGAPAYVPPPDAGAHHK